MNIIRTHTKSFLFTVFCLFGFLTTPTYADVNAVKLSNYDGNLKPVTTCMVGGKTKVIAPGPLDKTLRIWDFATGECEGVVGRHEGYVRSVTTCIIDGEIKVIAGYDATFSNSSSFSLTPSQNVQNTIRVWDLKTGKCEHTLRGHESSVEAVSTCILDGKTKLVSASTDKTVRIWDAETGICERVLLGHEDWVNSVASFTVGDKVKIVSGSQDGVVRVWDALSGECEHVLMGPKSTNCMLASALIKGEIKLVVGFQSRFTKSENSDLLTVWNLQTGEREVSIPMAKRFDSVFTFIENAKTYIVMGFMDGVLIFL